MVRNCEEHEVVVTGVTDRYKIIIDTEAWTSSALIRILKTENNEQEDFIELSISNKDISPYILMYNVV